MKEIIDLLTKKDRRILVAILLVLVIFLTFNIFVAQARKGRYLSARDSKAQADLTLLKAQEQLDSKKGEWAQWEEARTDLDTIKDKYLYSEQDIATEMRLDLEKILRETGFYVPIMDYEYEEYEREKIKKERISFMITGQYARVKRFIHSLETFPKFLVLEGVDFLDIATGSGMLKLRIHLAGYYE